MNGASYAAGEGTQNTERHSPFPGSDPKATPPMCPGGPYEQIQHSGIQETPGNNLTAIKWGQMRLGSHTQLPPGKAGKVNEGGGPGRGHGEQEGWGGLVSAPQA